jgi:hypothetical protein
MNHFDHIISRSSGCYKNGSYVKYDITIVR